MRSKYRILFYKINSRLIKRENTYDTIKLYGIVFKIILKIAFNHLDV